MPDSRVIAGDEFYTVILNCLTGERGVHAETAVAAAGRMAGTFLLRSFRLPIDDFPPGQSVYFEAVNDNGRRLIGLLGGTLQQLNVSVSVDPGQALALKDAFPPQLTILETQALLDQPLVVVAAKHGLAQEEAAEACTMTAARIIQACSSALDPNAAFGIAVYGIVEGSKTVPFRSEGDAEVPKPIQASGREA